MIIGQPIISSDLCVYTIIANADRIDFNYHQFNIGPQCTTVSWNYDGAQCSPVKFNLQGFYKQDVISYSYPTLTPRISVNSTTPVFKLPKGLLDGHTEDNRLYFRVHGVDASDRMCDASFSRDLYDIAPSDENGKFFLE